MGMLSHQELRDRVRRLGNVNRSLAESLSAAEAERERLREENRSLRKRLGLPVQPITARSIADDEDGRRRAEQATQRRHYDSSDSATRSRHEQVYDVVHQHGPIGVAAVAEQVGISRSYVAVIATSLRKAGRIRSCRQGQRVLLEAC